MRLRSIILPGAAAAAATGTLLAIALVVPERWAAQPQTTSHRTISGLTPDQPYSRLRHRPGWRRVVREDLARSRSGRRLRRTSLLYTAQMSDFQLADEESPIRVESLDLDRSPLTAAWRPQEAFGPQTVDQGVRQINRFIRSPLTHGRNRRARMSAVLVTGDNADSQQHNEVGWVVRLLEGGLLDPNSGVDRRGCGRPGEAAGYTGVQDISMADRFYDPDAPAGHFGHWPRHRGLMDRAQRPFHAQGLLAPSYVALGNHDGQVQGNVWASAPLDVLVQGCVKPLRVGGLAPGSLLSGGVASIVVPPDPQRRYVDRRETADLHRGRQIDAHGFGLVDPQESRASGGQATYYSFRPRPGVRLVSINTVAEGSLVGGAGNLDDPQFRWLERTLAAADAAGELVVLFGHHPIRSLTDVAPDEAATPCGGSKLLGPGCDEDPRNSQPIRTGADLQRLLLAHPAVVAYVAGHTHEHRVTPIRASGGGGFWAVETASHVDWPVQSRLLELMDNRDGTLSLFGTLIDHGAPLTPPADGSPAHGFSEEDLASLARELAFNDRQAGGRRAEGGVGRPEDRNVELLIGDPRG